MEINTPERMSELKARISLCQECLAGTTNELALLASLSASAARFPFNSSEAQLLGAMITQRRSELRDELALIRESLGDYQKLAESEASHGS